MIVKLLCTFDYNPETNTYTPVGDPEVIKSTKKKPVEEESSEPQLRLLDNKYSLNTAALDLLGVTAGDKIDIKYQIIGNVNYPIIGASTAWKSASGNKLTKSNTVSYRGKANTMLATFGEVFDFTTWAGHDGLFILIGDKEQVVDQFIEAKTDSSLEVDRKEEEVEVEEEKVDIPSDDDISIDDFLNDSESQDDYELSNFKFKF